MKQTLITIWELYCLVAGSVFLILLILFFVFGGDVSLHINFKESINELKQIK